ncbi:MAG: hypothetical protein DRJ15_07155 [Bacteroidetes bacterium]|nr:MAG: hypothetical protein DRJ15_07155 [Bacteroidota bacterium]
MIEITDKRSQKYYLVNKEQIAVIVKTDKGANIKLKAGYTILIGAKEWNRLKEEILTQKQTTQSNTARHSSNSAKKNGTRAKNEKKDGHKHTTKK